MKKPCRIGAVQRGFTVIAAVFILVVLSLLGAFILNVSGGQAQAVALDILGSRAYQAARAGLEWGAYQIYNPEKTSATPYDCTTPATTTITGLSGDLASFTVKVSCSMSTYTEFGNTIRVFQIVSNACNDGGGTCPSTAPSSLAYAERQITAVMATCRDAPSGGTSC